MDTSVLVENAASPFLYSINTNRPKCNSRGPYLEGIYSGARVALGIADQVTFPGAPECGKPGTVCWKELVKCFLKR